MKKSVPKEYYVMLEQLQEIDFVIVELNLYLDTHPNDINALAQHNYYCQIREQLKNQFEAQFGPLQNRSPSQAPWGWIDSPWPWQV